MFNLDMFKEIESLNEFNYTETTSKIIEMPTYAKKFCSLDAIAVPKVSKFEMILVADTEAFTSDNEGMSIKHECFMICWTDLDNGVNG